MGNTLYDHPAFYDMLFGSRRSDLSFCRELADEDSGEVLELGRR